GSCGRSSSGSVRNDARSVRFADVSDVTAFHADRQIGLGPLGDLVAPQEPRLQGDGRLRQDTLGRSQAAAPPPPARPPRAAQAPDFTYRYIFGRSDLDCCPRAGERGTLRGGSSSTRGEPATPSRPAPWRPLPASGLGRLQAVRLRLLRQAGEPGLGQRQGSPRLLPLHGLRRLSLRWPAPVLE